MTKFRNFGPIPSSFLLLCSILATFVLASDNEVMRDAKQMLKVFNVQGHHGLMARFEKKFDGWHQVGDVWRVNVGRNGLGKEKEGDGKTPVGTYPLGAVYGYEKLDTSMPFFKSDDNLLCVDDGDSRYYNRIIDRRRVIGDFKSFETMRRKDDLYEMVVTVGYNLRNIPGKGSCIFIHIADGDKPTAGCIALEKANMQKLVKWLDPRKFPVVRIERWVAGAIVAYLKIGQ